MNTHTPGPWHASDLGVVYTVAAHQANPNGLPIATCNANRGEITPATSNANARLIAAAPELLEALTDLLAHAEVVDAGNKNQHGRNCCGFAATVFARTRAALAKATIPNA